MCYCPALIAPSRRLADGRATHHGSSVNESRDYSDGDDGPGRAVGRGRGRSLRWSGRRWTIALGPMSDRPPASRPRWMDGRERWWGGGGPGKELVRIRHRQLDATAGIVPRGRRECIVRLFLTSMIANVRAIGPQLVLRQAELTSI